MYNGIMGGLQFFFIICLLVKEVNSYDEYWFSSPGFPASYSAVKLPQSSPTIYLDQDQGVMFKFIRFELGPEDCVYFCDGGTTDKCSNSTVNKLCGNAMDHRKPYFYYDASPSVTPIFVSSGGTQSYPGFQGAAQIVDKASQNYLKDACNQTIYLGINGPVFLISDHLGGMAQSGDACTVNFATNKTTLQIIRAAIYSFNSVSDEHMDFEYAGGRDLVSGPLSDPTAYYYQNSVSVNFQFSPGTYSFFISFLSFDANAGSDDGCFNTGSHVATLNDDYLYFQTKNLTTNYNSNLDCTWSFSRNMSENSQLCFDVYAQTEPCCDVLNIDGVDDTMGPYDFWGLKGYYFYYSQNDYLKMHFVSDGIEEYTGFQGRVTALDCDCGILNWNLTKDHMATMKTPEKQRTYCQNIECEYTISFPTNTILQFNVVKNDIYTGDYLMLTDYRGTQILQMSTPTVFSSIGCVNVKFTSQRKSGGITSNDKFKTGFSLAAQARNLYPTTIAHDLCKEEIVDIRGESITGQYRAHVHTFTSAACNQTIYTYVVSVNIEIYDTLILDGPLNGGIPRFMPANNSHAGVVPPIVHSGNEVTIRVSRIGTQVGYARILVTTQQYKPTVLRNPDILSIPGAYVGTTILYMDSLAIVGNSENHIGIQLNKCGPSNIDFFKGATTDIRNLVTSQQLYLQNALVPSFVFGPYLTLVKRDNIGSDTTCGTSSRIQDSIWAVTTSGTPGILMSPDYGTNGPYTTYKYSIQYDGEGNKAIIIQLLRPIGNGGTLTVLQIVNNEEMGSKTYDSSDGLVNLTANATRLSITYKVTNPDPTLAHGFLLRYSIGGSFKPSDSSASGRQLISLTFGLVLFVLFFKMN